MRAARLQQLRRRGISLLEALATLVLIAVVVPAAMQGVTISLRAAQQARHDQEASFLAESRLGEILALRDPAAYSGAGDFAPDFPEYRWEIQSATADFNMLEVWITVSWQERGAQRSMTLTTFVYPPATESGGTFTTQ